MKPEQIYVLEAFTVGVSDISSDGVVKSQIVIVINTVICVGGRCHSVDVCAAKVERLFQYHRHIFVKSKAVYALVQIHKILCTKAVFNAVIRIFHKYIMGEYLLGSKELRYVAV